jgi:hypothetical protein
MKNAVFAMIALATTTFASAAAAGTYTYTFNDLSLVPDQAKDTFNRSRYWEKRDTDRWGTLWESPYTFSTTYPSTISAVHFHIGFQGQDQCYDGNTQSMGKFVNNVCTPLDVWTNRGPAYSHRYDHALFFQLTKEDGTMVPFVVKNIDVHNTSAQSIDVYVRKTDGGWFSWGPLHGHLSGTPNWFRWTLTSGYTGKFTAMAWKTVSGGGYSSKVGRVQITD